MSTTEDFEQFWRSYPRRIGKGAARGAFARAIGKTTLENMLRAIADYIDNKPGYQDFKHPSTWLNQECWDDEWTAPPPSRNRRSTDMASFASEVMERYDERTHVSQRH